jgi:hypothetical protein
LSPPQKLARDGSFLKGLAKVGTIERLEVTKDQVEVDKENGNVEKVT